MVRFNVDYLGTTVVDKRFSNPMVPWVIADVKRRKKVQKVKKKKQIDFEMKGTQLGEI